MADYEQNRTAIDAVILTIKDGKLNVLLEVREKAPFEGKHELPGGLLQPGESAEETLQRKLKSVVGAKNVFFEQFQTFTNPKRDPRTRTISIGFIALISQQDAPEGAWMSLAELPPMAFDHKEIITKAHEHLKANLDSQVVKHFLPDKFPLNSLQVVHETIMDLKYDNRNFRRKLIMSETVVETKELEQNVAHRPALLYKFA